MTTRTKLEVPPDKIGTVLLNGKLIAYHSSTEFLIQVGKGKKGSYKTHYTITGNLIQAVIIFNGINLGNGYKKRLLAPSMIGPLLARVYS